ncbi:MAG: MarR family transcriptional regulator [Leifsonia sp.]|jgi:DNA-binding MarR family transcriptional regulator
MRTDDDELRMLLQRVARRIRNNRADGTMSDAKLGVLFRVEQEPASPSALAERERISPPSMNRTLNALEKAGFITRSPDPADARRVVVSITPSGRDLITETRRLRTAWFSQRLAELTPAERAAFEQLVPVLRRWSEL